MRLRNRSLLNGITLNAKALAATTLALLGAQSIAGQASDQKIVRTPETSQTVITGAPDRFTGMARVQSLFDAKEPGRTTGGKVTFQPGARSAWHTHPLGQILIVTDGEGWFQQWGQPVQVMRKGDVVWIPPGVKHWHGATPNTSVTHIAIQEVLDGRNTDWLEKVSDEQYRAAQ